MKKLLSLLAIGAMISLVACGPSKEEQEKAAQATADSIAKVVADSTAAADAAAAAKMTADSMAKVEAAAKATADSLAAAAAKKPAAKGGKKK
jgi:hypothetical protein